MSAVAEPVVAPVEPEVAEAPTTEPASVPTEAAQPSTEHLAPTDKAAKRRSFIPSGVSDKLKRLLNKALPKKEKTPTVTEEPPAAPAAEEPATEAVPGYPAPEEQAEQAKAETDKLAEEARVDAGLAEAN